MDELIMAKARYEELLARMDADIEQAEQFKADALKRYNPSSQSELMIALQSQVLRIQDYITQKFNNKVEILRSYDDLLKAIKEAE